MPATTRVTRETLVEDLLRLRRAMASAPDAADLLEPVAAHTRSAVGDGVPTTVAGRVLGVSHTAVARWLRSGELLRGARKGSQVDLEDLVDVAERVREERAANGSLRALATALRARLTDGARAAAADAGVEPALVAAWIRSGLLSADESGAPGPGELSWLRSHGQLVRVLHDAVSADPGIDTLVLFGSIARGDDTARSDVDLLIDGEVTADVAASSRMRGALIERLGRPVELVPLAGAASAPAVLVRALAEGRPVKDRRGRWRALQGEADRVAERAAAERATYRERERAALTALLGEPGE